jgi:hypothetical protein
MCTGDYPRKHVVGHQFHHLIVPGHPLLAIANPPVQNVYVPKISTEVNAVCDYMNGRFRWIVDECMTQKADSTLIAFCALCVEVDPALDSHLIMSLLST